MSETLSCTGGVHEAIYKKVERLMKPVVIGRENKYNKGAPKFHQPKEKTNQE